MNTQVQTDMHVVNVDSVENLYARYARMDIPSYYEEGQENPYAGLCRIVPKTASAYTMVPVREEKAIEMARKLLKGIGGRKKVREASASPSEVNYNMFAKAGDILVLYV